ncbi:thermonuclease family protein [Methylobacterium nigriterrae]|uniref:thermonuclease family protein n=1 Tax=Methylobacterium nigriterrae TaxID=3127512 RepID=UPI003013640A
MPGFWAAVTTTVCTHSQDYRCGQQAALALADHIGQSIVSCEPRDTDRYGRTVAVCRKGGEDLNAWMVAQGYAISYRRYSTDYVEAEATANSLKRGIWASTFQEPSEWRRARRAGGEQVGTTPEQAGPAASSSERADCRIKGNINRKGDHIYHRPGTRDYERTVVDEASGERMFCTEDEAKAAGWRAPRR